MHHSPERLILRRAALLVALLVPAVAPAQGGEAGCVSGWHRRVTGQIFDYHSAQRDVNRSLLVRSHDAGRFIEWETEPVPADHAGESVTFAWLFGIDANVEVRRWKLLVNDVEWLRFGNPRRATSEPWTVQGRGGSELRFRPTFVDRYEDLFGYAFLRLPRSAWTPGEPVRLKVVGESAGSPVWYMTFMSPVRETARLAPRSALLRGAGGADTWQPLVLRAVHLGEEVDVTVRSSLGTEDRARLEFGANEIEIRLPALREPREVAVEVELPGGEVRELSCVVEPVRPWTVYLVQHTHTDIGYTRPQTEILPEHLRYIDYALDYCDATDHFPDDARFRWTCEASWAVREYLASRTPEQIARLRRRVREGRIEATAMFFNMSEVMDEPTYSTFLQPVRAMRSAGLPVTTAMQNDVNGAAWCLADWFPGIGVRYLVMGQHGHRALKPFDVATSFWWESPAGSRVLAFRADHYNTGNRWGVHTAAVETVERGLFDYLESMEASGYPFDRVAVQYSGYLTDNSPPSTAGNRLIRAWNEKYARPRLRSATAGDFPRWVEKHHAEELPVVRAAWPDWWTDGFGSAPRESAAARWTQAETTATEGLLAIERALGLAMPPAFGDALRAIRERLIFYGEHTFGAAESIRAPLSENSRVQWAEKSAYVWEAVKDSAVLREKALGRFQTLLEPTDSPLLAVVNTLAHPRSGPVEVYVDHQILSPSEPFRIVDDEGRQVAAQRERSREDGSYWTLHAPDVPAMGYRTYRIEVGGEPENRETAGSLPLGAVIENDWYRLSVDPVTGALASLFDKELGRELLDLDAEWKAGAVVYETLSDRAQLEAFRLEGYERRTVSDVRLLGARDGPVWRSLALTASLPCCDPPQGLRMEARLFHHAKRVELRYAIEKRRSFDPEGLYVAFPFAFPDGEVVYETLGGTAAPDRDLIPGAASDWQGMQSFAAVRSPAGQVVVGSDEIPLVQLGAINLGKFRRRHELEAPAIFSWVMNNYWTTNFKASAEGEFRWSYYLTSSKDTSNAFAARFGQENRIPLLARVLPEGAERRPTASASVLQLEPSNLLLVSALPARRSEGVLLLVREVDGVATRGALTAPGTGAAIPVQVVNALEREELADEDPLRFRPYQAKFLRWLP